MAFSCLLLSTGLIILFLPESSSIYISIELSTSKNHTHIPGVTLYHFHVVISVLAGGVLRDDDELHSSVSGIPVASVTTVKDLPVVR